MVGRVAGRALAFQVRLGVAGKGGLAFSRWRRASHSAQVCAAPPPILVAAFAERGEAGLGSRPEPKTAAERQPKARADDADPAQLSAEARVAELERQLGSKQLEVDFLRRTFEHVRGVQQQRAASGATTSTTPSAADSGSKDRA